MASNMAVLLRTRLPRLLVILVNKCPDCDRALACGQGKGKGTGKKTSAKRQLRGDGPDSAESEAMMVDVESE